MFAYWHRRPDLSLSVYLCVCVYKNTDRHRNLEFCFSVYLEKWGCTCSLLCSLLFFFYSVVYCKNCSVSIFISTSFLTPSSISYIFYVPCIYRAIAPLQFGAAPLLKSRSHVLSLALKCVSLPPILNIHPFIHSTNIFWHILCIRYSFSPWGFNSESKYPAS